VKLESQIDFTYPFQFFVSLPKKKFKKILTHYGKVQASIAKVKRSYAEFYRPHSLSLQGI
jgi:hypothetical protein